MISKNTSIKELALIVATELKKSQIDVVLVGGAVVSIYTQNDYESGDLDFISYSNIKEIDKVMVSMGFIRRGKSYLSDLTDLYVEFPSGPIAVGDELLDKFNEIREGELALKLFTPTQSIMDRLAAYYFWKDEQSLDQAVMIAKAQPYSLSKVKCWSEKEGELEKFAVFERILKRT